MKKMNVINPPIKQLGFIHRDSTHILCNMLNTEHLDL